ncbi:Retrotransposon gag protein [Gossypium australe]|uniref:Retrotransposon gag protein n=1 Tax=Gossypium australe TaxID=47621 RepID=A0A5B6WDZ4_9ROSI|nr:Retrotransposon gag protein [Gossypium australe]
MLKTRSLLLMTKTAPFENMLFLSSTTSILYFPPSKNVKLCNEITLFQQLDEESLYELWEQFNELLRKCPHHSIPHCIQLETFYNGLKAHTRMIIDASANEAFLAKSPPVESSNNLEKLLNVYMAKNYLTLRNLENQVGQLTNELRSRPQGVLPSDAKNPRNVGKEHCKAVTLRNWRTLEIKDSEAEDEPSITQNKEKIQRNVEI